MPFLDLFVIAHDRINSKVVARNTRVVDDPLAELH